MAARAAARRPGRLRVPVLPPDAVADGAGERDAAAGARGPRPMRAVQRGRCSAASAWRSDPATIPGSSRAASSSAWRWPGLAWCARRCCSRTSRPATSIPPPAQRIAELLFELNAEARHDAGAGDARCPARHALRARAVDERGPAGLTDDARCGTGPADTGTRMAFGRDWACCCSRWWWPSPR